MNMHKVISKLSGWLLSAALLFAASGAFAATSDNIDIHVSIAGNKSVLVSGATSYDFGALAVNSSSVSASAITVQNDSTVFIETYTITGANALSDAGGTDWTLAATPDSDQYALAAQFSTARPSDADGSWTADDLTGSASTCSQTAHGNGTEAEAGSNVSPSENRSLWFRLKTPTSVTDSGAHTVTVTVSVL